jgi:hypothetical protein
MKLKKFFHTMKSGLSITIITSLLLISNIKQGLAQTTTISGVVNLYTQVRGIDTVSICSLPVLTVSDTTGFRVGDTVLIIQMKGASIATTNDTTFGTINNYNTAGNYEFNTILSKGPNDIELVNILAKPYDTTGFVQLVRVPSYKNAAVNVTLTAAAWNGTTGGVLAIEVADTLSFNANSKIQADGLGFRQGDSSLNYSSIATFLGFVYPAGFSAGNKGEGIAQLPVGDEAGRGADANGGGGGDGNGGGGGGGANYGFGGGGGGQNYTGYKDNGGMRGKNLTYSNSLNTIFMGGGGGGGFQNNDAGTPGGNGAGIIIIRANTIVGNGGSITAIGNTSPASTANDGTGGGGAGGTILLDVQNYSGNLTISTNAGNGGNNPNTGDGPGGGGGGGILWISGNAALASNVTYTSTAGTHGSNDDPTNIGLRDGQPGGFLNGLQIPQSNNPTFFNHKVEKITLGCGSNLGSSFKLNNVPTPSNAVYSWFPAAGLSCTNCPSPVASPTVTTIYYVAVNTTLSCPYSYTFPDTVIVDGVGGGGATGGKITAATDTICPNSSEGLTLVNFQGNAFQWQSGISASGPFSSAGGADTSAYTTPALTENTYYRVLVTNGACGSAFSDTFKLSVMNNTNGGNVTAARDTICEGTPGNLTLTNFTGSAFQWQSMDSANGHFTNITNAETTKYKSNPLMESTWYRVLVNSGNCSAISDTLELYVPPALVASFNDAVSGATVTFNSDSSMGGIRSYSWAFGDDSISKLKNPTHTFHTYDTTYYTCLTLYDGSNCSYTFCKYVSVGGSGVNSVSAQNKWAVYPNPIGNYILINSNGKEDNIESIEMYDVLGRVALNKNFGGAQNLPLKIDASNLAEGMYYLKIQTRNESFVQPVVKQ